MNAPRRGALGAMAAAGAALAALLSGCALNPATGERSFTAFMSLEDERRIRDEEHPKILARFGGAYDDPALTAYVAETGEALAATSETPEIDFRFTVLNSPVVNAFALPGGYIYVSRGLLALADSEAELASVLAHEIGHVAARHAAQRYSRHVLANFGASLLDIITVGGLAEAAEDEAAAFIQDYTREQEFEADTLGFRYMRRAGWDTGAITTFLNKLTAYRALEAKLRGLSTAADEPLDALASHPRTTERLDEVIGLNGDRPKDAPRLNRLQYLKRIDGMLFGDDPVQGFVRGSTFIHPGLGFRFQVPAGFYLINGVRRVTARGPDDTTVLFDTDKGGLRPQPAVDYLTKTWAVDMNLIDVETIFVNGMEAATGWERVKTDQGDRDVRLVAIRFDPGTVYRFMFFTRPEATGELSAALRRITYSFRRLQAEERKWYRPLRLTLVTAEVGDTAASLAALLPFAQLRAERFAVLNGLVPGTRIRAGDRLKIVTE